MKLHLLKKSLEYQCFPIHYIIRAWLPSWLEIVSSLKRQCKARLNIIDQWGVVLYTSMLKQRKRLCLSNLGMLSSFGILKYS